MQGHLSPRLKKACYFCLILSTKANQDQLIYEGWRNKFYVLVEEFQSHIAKIIDTGRTSGELGPFYIHSKTVIINRTLANLK